jgi:hypothetical protein
VALPLAAGAACPRPLVDAPGPRILIFGGGVSSAELRSAAARDVAAARRGRPRVLAALGCGALRGVCVSLREALRRGGILGRWVEGRGWGGEWGLQAVRRLGSGPQSTMEATRGGPFHSCTRWMLLLRS